MKIMIDDNKELIDAHRVTLYKDNDEHKNDPFGFIIEGDYLYITSWYNIEIFPEASNRIRLAWRNPHG